MYIPFLLKVERSKGKPPVEKEKGEPVPPYRASVEGKLCVTKQDKDANTDNAKPLA